MKKSRKIILLIIGIVFSMSFLSGFKTEKKTLLTMQDEIINISEVSDSFMTNYFEGVSRIQQYESEDNMLIVTSVNELENTYGAIDVVAGPNNQYFLQYESLEQKDLALKSLREDDSNLFVEENNVRTLSDFDEHTYNSWGIEKTGLNNAINISNSNILNEVVVAIIDTGCNVELFEEEYKGKIINTYNVLDGTSDVFDVVTHGTHVAGTIAEGTPDNVKILPVKVSNYKRMYISDIITAINYIVYNNLADVINMSFGGDTFSYAEYYAISAAYDNNIICVAAAGNESSDILEYPASFDTTMSISAVDSNNILADFSSYGNEITFAAPGVNIKSVGKIDEKDPNTDKIKSGTSMATPHAASAAAIVKSFYPDYSLEQVIDLLKKYAIDLGTVGWDSKYGYGLINFDTEDLCEESSNCLFKDKDLDLSLISITSDYGFSVYGNYGNNSNILNASVFLNFKNGKKELKKLWELDDLEIIGYDPYDYSIQNVTVKYLDFECIIVINNENAKKISFEYEVVDESKKIIKITKFLAPSQPTKKLIIPEIIDGYTVVGIGKDAFKEDSNLMLLEMPDTITFIEDGAFYNCYNLINVLFSDNLESIGNSAFEKCSHLEKLKLPDSLKTIGEHAFYDDWGLKELYISKNVSFIGQHAFYNNQILERIVVDTDNEYYTSGDNGNCLVEKSTNKLILGSTKTIIPDFVSTIGEAAFYGNRIAEIIIPEGVTKIEENAFALSGLVNAFLPRSLEDIHISSFKKSGGYTLLWVYKNSYSWSFGVEHNNMYYRYRETTFYDIEVSLDKTNYNALETFDESGLSIKLKYFLDDITYVDYTGDYIFSYETGNPYFSVLDNYIMIGVNNGYGDITKNVNVSVNSIDPEYIEVSTLTAYTGQYLSEVELPENFYWKNENKILDEEGLYTFKAYFDKKDINYNVIEDIDINVSVSKGKKLITPIISIDNKIYNGEKDIPFDNIKIDNLNSDNYTIISAESLDSKVGSKVAKVKIRLNDDFYENNTLKYNNQEFEYKVLFKIVPIKLSYPTLKDLNYVYNGENQDFEINGFDSNIMNVSGNSGTNAGNYNIVISLTDPDYTWEDGNSDDCILVATINKAVPKYNVPTKLFATIGNKLSSVVLDKNFSWETPDTLLDNLWSNVYYAKYIPDDLLNYEVVEHIAVEVYVEKVKTVIYPSITVADIPYNDKKYDIDFSLITVSNLDKDDYSIVSATVDSYRRGARTVKVTLKLSDEKYIDYKFDNNSQIKTFSVPATIVYHLLKKPTAVDKVYNYTGEEQSIELNDFYESGLIISNNIRKDIGTQEVLIRLKDSNYKWEDGTSNPVTIPFTIEKASLDGLYEFKNNNVYYNGEYQSLKLETNAKYDIKTLYMDEDGNYTLTEIPKYKNAGNYEIKYKMYIDDNYCEKQGTVSFTINKLDIKNNTKDYFGYFDSKSHSIDIDGIPNDCKILYSINNKKYDLDKLPSFKDIGKYKVYYKVSCDNYNTLESVNEVTIFGVLNYGNNTIKDNNLVIKNNDYTSLINSIEIYSLNKKFNHYNSNGKELNNNFLSTGDKIKIIINDNMVYEYIVSYQGDVNGDGKITALDYVMVRNHIMNNNVINNDIVFSAADIYKDDRISALDYINIKNIIMSR